MANAWIFVKLISIL